MTTRTPNRLKQGFVRGSLIACLGVTQGALAQTTYDFARATRATGSAGMIATNVDFSTPESGGLIVLWTTKAQSGPGCEYTGCADGVNGPISATADGALRIDMKDTPVGPVKGVVPYSGGRYVEVDRQAYITGHSNGQGSLYTELIDPANTSFSFTFSGHSATAGQGLKVNLGLRDLADWSKVLFSQTVTGNEAGDWQLVIETPLGMDLMGKNLYFDLSATAGSNTVSSLLITPHLQAVPEPAAWTLMGLGLAVLGANTVPRRRPSSLA